MGKEWSADGVPLELENGQEVLALTCIPLFPPLSLHFPLSGWAASFCIFRALGMYMALHYLDMTLNFEVALDCS